MSPFRFVPKHTAIKWAGTTLTFGPCLYLTTENKIGYLCFASRACARAHAILPQKIKHFMK